MIDLSFGALGVVVLYAVGPTYDSQAHSLGSRTLRQLWASY